MGLGHPLIWQVFMKDPSVLETHPTPSQELQAQQEQCVCSGASSTVAHVGVQRAASGCDAGPAWLPSRAGFLEVEGK